MWPISEEKAVLGTWKDSLVSLAWFFAICFIAYLIGSATGSY